MLELVGWEKTKTHIQSLATTTFSLSIQKKFLSFLAESPQQVKGSLQSLNLDAVMNQTFIPDYSVRATTDVFYVAIKRTLYLAAKRATLMEKSKRFGSELGSNEPIDYEVEKVRFLQSQNKTTLKIN